MANFDYPFLSHLNFVLHRFFWHHSYTCLLFILEFLPSMEHGSWSNPQKLIILKAAKKPLHLLSSIHLNLLNHCLKPDLLGIWVTLRYNLRLPYYLVPACTIVYTWMKVVYVRNKWLCHERLCPENKVLHLMLYYELKLYWMKICWLYEGPWIIFFTFVPIFFFF
jgi:hypothetical protein